MLVVIVTVSFSSLTLLFGRREVHVTCNIPVSILQGSPTPYHPTILYWRWTEIFWRAARPIFYQTKPLNAQFKVLIKSTEQMYTINGQI